MTLRQLKQDIENSTVSDELIVFVSADDTWLANQYVESIALSKNLAINKISSLAEIEDSALSLVFNFEDRLNVLKVETFEEYRADYSTLKNVIIICDKIDKKLEKNIFEYIIKIPKLVDWQVKDYMNTILCPGLSQEDLNWLYDTTNGNIYRIENILAKVNIFDKEKRSNVLAAIKATDLDLYNLPYYVLPDAILTGNGDIIKSYLYHKDYCEISPFSVISLLLTNYKKYLMVGYLKDNKAILDDMGIKSNQLWAIQKKAKTISLEKIMTNIEFLSNVDYKVRSGLLDMSDDKLMDYIICNLLA